MGHVNVKSMMLGATLLAAALLTAAQDPQVIRELPEDLAPFWSKYWPAKVADDEEEMDKAVRLHQELANRTLNILLDDYCSAPNEGLPDELRALGWSMDRVDRQTRFIERVRYVLGLEPGPRLQRYGLMQDLYAAEAGIDGALASNAESDWAAVADQFRKTADGFEKMGDVEFALIALKQVADIEQRLNRQWERATTYKRIAGLATRLPYKEPLADEAAFELDRLKGLGFDPDLPRPDPTSMGPGGGEGAQPAAATGKGRTLDAFAAGSEALTVKLELDVPKKGLAPVVLPTFAPLENEFLWHYSWLEGNGPKPFDTQRSVKLMPGGQVWNLMRDGQHFSLDGDGDGEGDVSFSPTSSPQRVDVPLKDGRTWPILVTIPGDREQMFGTELNYSPQPAGARLRFQLAAAQRGEVLGEPWLVYDSNFTGVYGDVVDEWGDGFTASTEGEEPFFREADAVLVGKARVALPWSTVLPLADGFYRTTITPEGGEVTVRKLDLETGFVKLDCASKVQPTHVLIEEVGGTLPGAILNVVPAKKGGSVVVPAGTWQFGFGRLESGSKTGMQQVRIYRGRSKPFEVKPGETSTLALGAPYALRLRPGMEDLKTAEGETQILFHSLRIFGRGGEEYTLLHDDPLQPEVEIVGPDGKKLGKPHKTMRADISLWQSTGERAMYYPAPLVVPELKGAHTFRLSQKTHALLGGPMLPEEPAKAGKDGGKP
jgi:hypothetical protein